MKISHLKIFHVSPLTGMKSENQNSDFAFNIRRFTRSEHPLRCQTKLFIAKKSGKQQDYIFFVLRAWNEDVFSEQRKQRCYSISSCETWWKQFMWAHGNISPAWRDVLVSRIRWTLSNKVSFEDVLENYYLSAHYVEGSAWSLIVFQL